MTRIASAANVQSLDDTVLDALAACVEKIGIDRLTVDDVAQESGVSRATIYRHFGNKEAMLKALLARTARPFEDDARRLLNSDDPFPLRMEATVAWAAEESKRHAFAMAILAHGVSNPVLELFETIYSGVLGRLLRPVFAEAQASGEMSAELDVEETISWLLRELLYLISAPVFADVDVRLRVRRYILPVLVQRLAPADEARLKADVRAMARRLEALDDALHEARADLRQMAERAGG
jgi:AcrR family transcriptional regulator